MVEPANWFWFKAAAVVFAIAGVAAWLDPAFGVPYLVTGVFLLPLLLPFLFSPRVRRWEEALGGLGRVAVFAAVFLYIALVKSILAPIVLAELGYFAA
jgi:hypothetical protein